MATVVISAGSAGAGQASIPSVMFAKVRASQTITTSASNTVATVIGRMGETVVVYAETNAVKIGVAEGANPDATAAAQHIAPAGSFLALYCQADDTRFAVTDL